MTISETAPTGGVARRRLPRWLIWLGAAALAVLIALGIAAEYVAHNAEPILRRRVIATMQDRFKAPVELDQMHISVLQGLEVSGSGLRILKLDETGSRSVMLAANSFAFRTTLRQLMLERMHIGLVRVDGMQVNIPPRQERGPLLSPRGGKKRFGKTPTGLIIDEVVCRNLTLTIETDKPGKEPLVFDIRDVNLHDVGEGNPLAFEAALVNPKPVGDIRSTGHFGPWQSDDPQQTPLDGSYSFTHADLATIKGISGTLLSTGTFGGTLGEIGVAGSTDTPDFALDVSEHPVDLKTVFNATVDGTTGDTRLNAVHAILRHTELQLSGVVMRVPDAQGQRGHLIDISVASDRARVEDVLTLGVRTSPPLVSGALTLRARLKIPPGHASVSRKMRIAGTFAVRGATFSNPRWQQTVDKLSVRASGNLKQTDAADAQRVTSAMSGSFALADAVLDMPKLDFQIPGAQVSLAGKYGLDGKTFDFDGTVRTRATASQMLTGWKSIVAMPLDKLLKKDGAGLEVPITLRGTESDPKLGVDLGRLGAEITGRHKGQNQPTPPRQP